MDKKRLQFDFTKEAVEEFDELQQAAGLTSRAELIRHALRFFQWALAETSTDNTKLLVEREGKTREIIFPFWYPEGRSSSQASEESERAVPSRSA